MTFSICPHCNEGAIDSIVGSECNKCGKTLNNCFSVTMQCYTEEQINKIKQSARRDAFREALEIVNTEVPYTSFGPSRSRQLKEFIVNRLKQKMEGA